MPSPSSSTKPESPRPKLKPKAKAGTTPKSKSKSRRGAKLNGAGGKSELLVLETASVAKEPLNLEIIHPGEKHESGARQTAPPAGMVVAGNLNVRDPGKWSDATAGPLHPPPDTAANTGTEDYDKLETASRNTSKPANSVPPAEGNAVEKKSETIPEQACAPAHADPRTVITTVCEKLKSVFRKSDPPAERNPETNAGDNIQKFTTPAGDAGRIAGQMSKAEAIQVCDAAEVKHPSTNQAQRTVPASEVNPLGQGAEAVVRDIYLPADVDHQPVVPGASRKPEAAIRDLDDPTDTFPQPEVNGINSRPASGNRVGDKVTETNEKLKSIGFLLTPELEEVLFEMFAARQIAVNQDLRASSN